MVSFSSCSLTLPATNRAFTKTCSYSTFQYVVNATDMDAPYEEATARFSLATSDATARRLRRGRQRLGARRHDLVVAMRIVNGMESELIQSEWENWLADENARCELATNLLRHGDRGDGKEAGSGDQSRKNADGSPLTMQPDQERRGELKKWHRDYCGSCLADQRALLAQRNSLI